MANAVKFTPNEGSVSFSAKLKKPGVLRVKISDTGVGIPKGEQKDLFQAFKQASTSTARNFGGTGLGLTISKQIIEMMGGNIRVESELNEGATFIFTVPFEEGNASDPAEYDSNDYSKALTDMGLPLFENCEVLIAEDIEVNREIIHALLENTGITADFAKDGFEAVSKFEENPNKYDIILMDIQMPEMDGFEAAKAIRALKTEKSNEIPIIAMTANVFKEDIDRCISAGMNDHVGKPIDREVLLKTMWKCLQVF